MGSRVQVWVTAIVVQILVVAAETNPLDVAALIALKSIWKNTPPNWIGSDPCDTGWEGIKCRNSRVTSMILAGTNLTGSLSGDILSLSELQYLDLSNNRGLTGTLPSSIGNLKELQFLIFVGCSFYGPIPDSIGSLQQLVFLSLNSNNFTGQIPSSIGNLSSLKWLDLTDNMLNGTIPVSGGNTTGLDMLVNAMHFHLGKNQLSGSIPPQLFHSNMSLIHVILDNNRLVGNIPSTLGYVQTLEVIRLDWNSLNGSVPSNFNNLTSVSELYLSNNYLIGLVPNLTGMNVLNYVDMSNNSFDPSEVPTWFTSLPSLTTLMMERTQLQGQLPVNLFSLPQLQSVVLSNNRIKGTLDIGTNYSSQLTLVNLQNNSITNYTQVPGSNIDVILIDNPLCERAGEAEGYCTKKSNSSHFTPSNNCTSTSCSSDKVPSPSCKCGYPYMGTLHFMSFAFSNMENSSYYKSLTESLMSALNYYHLPVDSISLSNPTLDTNSYLQIGVQIFPSKQDRFNRTGISAIGSLLNSQPFRLTSSFGPFFFIDDSYCCFAEFSLGQRKSSNTGIIVGAAVGGSVLVLLLFGVGIYAFHLKQRAKRPTELNPFASWDVDKNNANIPHLKGARWFSFEELEESTNYFSEATSIGSGGFGKVYKGILSSGQLVAIKRAQQGSLQGALEFKTEIELLSRVHHKNIVNLVGFCYDQGEQILVYEYVANGTLTESLSGKSGIHLNWLRRLTIALDSARGLAYLHEHANPPIIHRDIKSSNILLDDHLNAKVADFGISKIIQDRERGYLTTQVKGTLGYLDPEYYTTYQLTEKSDVYSFGIVLLELVTARPPIEQGKHIVGLVKNAMAGSKASYNLLEIVDPALGTPLQGLEQFMGLAMRCTQDYGAERPTMSEAVREIENIMKLFSSDLNAKLASTLSIHEIATEEESIQHPISNPDFFNYSGEFLPPDVERR
ncbi:Non-specific serine/threonine protein kinase [Bertholletia excelsa]